MEDVDTSARAAAAAAAADIPHAQNDRGTDRSEKRNKNLDILKAYIQRQRTLLERIKLDVDRLRESKQLTDDDPLDALDRILNNSNCEDAEEEKGDDERRVGSAEKLSALVNEVRGGGETAITKTLDWELFKGHDHTRLHALATRPKPAKHPPATSAHMPPPPRPASTTASLEPAKTSLSAFVYLPPECRQSVPLAQSALRIHVREKRSEIVDPALASAAQFLATLPPDLDDECTKAARAREAKEVRAREAREARQTRAREKEARAKPRRGRVANRKKGEVTAAAVVDPRRGSGGRFRGLNDVANDALEQIAQSQVASTSGSASTSAAPTPGPSSRPRQRQQRFPSASPSIIGLDDDQPVLETGGRSQRVRRPSTRYGSPTPSVVSAISARSAASAGATGQGKGKARASPATRWNSSASSASPAPEGVPPMRLTIRIPPRPTLTWSAPVADAHSGQFSASTSFATSMSASTNVSASTSLGSVPGYGIGSTAQAGERHSYSPATTTRSASVARVSGVKQEDGEHDESMDVDGVGIEDIAADDIGHGNGNVGDEHIEEPASSRPTRRHIRSPLSQMTSPNTTLSVIATTPSCASCSRPLMAAQGRGHVPLPSHLQ
ncbi:hypothetical protein DFH11DRAFT_520194 [Phellopilus nigrolimitatus]|nr:hypothetical protein DFH11DRAFT_520194 [Phellopilus nigrolimitatus]